MNRSHAKQSKKTANLVGAGWKPTLIAFGISVGIGAVLILLASLGVYLTPDPGRLIRPFAFTAAALTYLAAGAVAAKLCPDAPLATGAINGLLLSAFFLAASLLFRQTATALPAYATALLHAGMILLSLLGAYLAVLKKIARPKRKHA